ncbi:conserved hypothetical protein [Mesorhizobium prunaredense]|uniref:Uncharacterized protein n=1 Tax=Mesorhizobium prunaredense TaxID=1631249 RepID=A0A1R3VE41_9HYPH|nr:conserved hypothetical protein [Mesorhizobium prunaredense]
MAANWDFYQTLNSGRIEFPKGDQTVSTGYTPRWVEAWAVQGGGMGPGLDLPGPSQSTAHGAGWSAFPPNRWTADWPGWISGTFQPGPAVGIALLASRNGGATEYNWWFGLVYLY